jgi:hypothetical protein
MIKMKLETRKKNVLLHNAKWTNNEERKAEKALGTRAICRVTSRITFFLKLSCRSIVLSGGGGGSSFPPRTLCSQRTEARAWIWAARRLSSQLERTRAVHVTSQLIGQGAREGMIGLFVQYAWQTHNPPRATPRGDAPSTCCLYAHGQTDENKWTVSNHPPTLSLWLWINVFKWH